VAVILTAAVSASPVSAAWSRAGHPPTVERHAGYGVAGCPGCAFLGGVVVGGLLAGAAAAPVYAPQPVCYAQPGYWSQAPVTRPDGYTEYQSVWVPPQTVCQ
jgi:hypothetical protein